MSYNNGRDELFWRIGHEESKELLKEVEKLQKVDFVDDMGRTYLHVACSAYNIEVAKVLLQKGVNPNIKDKKGKSPLLSAIGRVHKTKADFLKTFLEYGLDLNENVSGMTLRETIESFEDEALNAVLMEFEAKK